MNGEGPAFELHSLSSDDWALESVEVQCGSNQHTCMPRMRVEGSDKHYDLILRGTGDSTIVGHPFGPRALLWEDTQLEGHDDELGALRMTLEPDRPQAGTLTPIAEGEKLPAINRNTYYFLFDVENVGQLVSEKPAIVEALIDAIPPTARYEFKNGPLAFHMRDDSEHRPVVWLESAVTDVAPEQ